MRIKITLCPTLLLIFSTFHYAGNAQKQADHWYFGQYAGLDFSSGSLAVVTDGALSTPEGCSAISDSSGQLLLYTDGIFVYNRMHDTMPNGNDLTGDISSTQSALIVPQPGQPNIYYIFTVDADGGPDGFRYSIVDMSLDGGLGAVTSKNVLIRNSVTEKLTAVSNRSGTEYWIMVHVWGSDAFEAYRLTSSGFNATPVISNTGAVHQDNIIQNTYGQMKFSPDGKRLGLGSGYQGVYEIFDFNDCSGTVSHLVTLPGGDRAYGFEFSNDNSKIYTTYYDVLFDLFYLDQFDLSSNDTALIKASQSPIHNSSDQLRQLQLAPDGKIYLAKGFQPYLGVINDPNEVGSMSNFQDFAVDLDPNFTGLIQSTIGLPGFVQSFFDTTANSTPLTAISIDKDTICANDSAQICVDHTFSTYSWNNGMNTQCIYTSLAGNYYATVTDVNGCEIHTNLLPLAIYPQPPVSIVVSGDTLSSFGAVFYQWYLDGAKINGATNSVYISTQNGSYTLEITDANGCIAMSTPVIISSVANISEPGVHIYPNPSGTGALFLNTNGEQEGSKLDVIDAQGKIVYRSVIANSNSSLHQFPSSPGIYLVRIYSDKVNLVSKWIRL